MRVFIIIFCVFIVVCLFFLVRGRLNVCFYASSRRVRVLTVEVFNVEIIVLDVLVCWIFVVGVGVFGGVLDFCVCKVKLMVIEFVSLFFSRFIFVVWFFIELDLLGVFVFVLLFVVWSMSNILVFFLRFFVGLFEVDNFDMCLDNALSFRGVSFLFCIGRVGSGGNCVCIDVGIGMFLLKFVIVVLLWIVWVVVLYVKVVFLVELNVFN